MEGLANGRRGCGRRVPNFACKPADEIRLGREVGGPVGPQDVVEPDLRFRAALLRSPRKDRLRSAPDEAPVHCPDVVGLEERQNLLEAAAGRPGHVLGANHRAAQGLHGRDPLLRIGPCLVGVERDDVRLFNLEPVEFREVLRFVPDANCQGLGRAGRAGPGEDAPDQGQRSRSVVRVPRFVVEVPGQDPPVLPEEPNDPLRIGLEYAPTPRTFKKPGARTLDPTRVVDARTRRRLRPRGEFGVPAVVEQDEHCPDVVTVGDLQEALEPAQEPARVLLPEQVVEEDPDRVEAEILGPAELLVDDEGIEGLRLPHLERVDRRPRDVVAAERPRLATGPNVGLLGRPARGGGVGVWAGKRVRS